LHLFASLKFADKSEILSELISKLGVQYEELCKMIASVQDSVNSEDKSSVGDKYETSRAMGQLEVERMSLQVRTLEKDINLLKTIDPKRPSQMAETGAVIVLEGKTLFISVGAGRFAVKGKDMIAVSPKAPIATELIGKKKGERLFMAGVEMNIEDIF
jgi:transcription elongation GreA/GreB family factor